MSPGPDPGPGHHGVTEGIHCQAPTPREHLQFKGGIKVTDDDTNDDNEMTPERIAA
jgi:hypothetical protein